MNKRIRRMIKQIEKRGGIVGVNDSLPDEIAEAFLREVLACPDCCAKTGDPVDASIEEVLAGATAPGKRREH